MASHHHERKVIDLATFVSTTLQRRTGATNVVFAPQTIEGGIGTLAESGSYQSGYSSRFSISSKRTGNSKRVTRLKFAVPLVDTTTWAFPQKLSECTAELVVTIPDGTPTANVNDLIGYVEKACASTVVNLNAVLVTGEGVY